MGSLATDTWDRWSDIDMIVVARGGAPAYWALFTRLARHKPVLHHNAFQPRVEPAGANLLGVTFADESVFHLLDLNFLSPSEYGSPADMARFGPVRELYVALDHSTGVVAVPAEPVPPPASGLTTEDPDEMQVWVPLHFTHKAIRRLLRGCEVREELDSNATRLRNVLSAYPDGIPTARGDICPIAHTFLRMTEHLLSAKPTG
jgi:hypothetical protein